MKRFWALHLLVCAAVMPGCASRAMQVGGVTTYDGLSDAYHVEALASNAAIELARRYPPGRTSLALVRAPGQFGESLENALRGQGFVLTTPDGSGVRVGYVLDEVQEEALPTGYLQVMTSDGQRFGFVERLSGARPVSPATSSPVPAPIIPEPYQLPQLPPSSSPVSTPLAASPLPSIAAMPSGESAPLAQEREPGWPVRKTSSAADIARRNNLPVQAFCEWNGLAPTDIVPKGRQVLLQKPKPRPVPPVSPVTPAEPPVGQAVAQVSAPAPVTQTATTAALNEFSTLPTAPAPVADELVIAAAPPAEESWALRPAPLNGQLGMWAERAGYQLVWQADNDYLVEFHASFRGAFVGALQQLFAALHKQGVPLRVTLYEENKIIKVIEE